MDPADLGSGVGNMLAKGLASWYNKRSEQQAQEARKAEQAAMKERLKVAQKNGTLLEEGSLDYYAKKVLVEGNDNIKMQRDKNGNKFVTEKLENGRYKLIEYNKKGEICGEHLIIEKMDYNALPKKRKWDTGDTVNFILANKNKKLKTWYKYNPGLHHDGNIYMFDIGIASRGGAYDWYGPDEDFTVKFAGVKGGYGGTIILELDGNRQVLLGHFTDINYEILEAARSNGAIRLEAGTFLGYTKSDIGQCRGPHVHGEGWIQRGRGKIYKKRSSIINWLRGRR